MKSLFGSQPKNLRDGFKARANIYILNSKRKLPNRVCRYLSSQHLHICCLFPPFSYAKLLPMSSIDGLTIPSRGGKGVLRRINEVFDCWFESGSMPYAQAHYPFENKREFEDTFPADFIAEGIDQTRGW